MNLITIYLIAILIDRIARVILTKNSIYLSNLRNSRTSLKFPAISIKKMKILQTVKKCLALEGYCANRGAFNRLQLWIGFKCIVGLFFQTSYLFFGLPKTPKEYMDSIFMSMVGITVFISFVSTVFKTEKIFEFMEKIEEIVNAREFEMEHKTKIFGLIESQMNFF